MLKRKGIFGAVVFILATNAGCERVETALAEVEEFLGTIQPNSEYKDRTTPIEADFVVTGDNLYYKGQRLPLLEGVQKLIDVLGNNYRKRGELIYMWDELGAYCHLSDISRKVVQISLIMRREPESARWWTKKLYEKDLVVDGAVINRDTPIGQFNRNKKGERFRKRMHSYYQYFNETTVAGRKTSVTFSIHVNFDRQVDEFTVSVPCDGC